MTNSELASFCFRDKLVLQLQLRASKDSLLGTGSIEFTLNEYRPIIRSVSISICTLELAASSNAYSNTMRARPKSNAGDCRHNKELVYVRSRFNVPLLLHITPADDLNCPAVYTL
jgi:hypothetical protein